MTDKDGNQIGTTVKYLPFGETRLGSVPTDKLFTGQRLDGTGLYYYNARYYDPTIGRFISADTVIQNPANPQCFNRYSYCLNNPLKYRDPSGHTVTFADEKAEAAWKLYADTCPSLATYVEESNTNYTMQFSDISNSEYNSDTKTISISSNNHSDDPRAAAASISHEMVHLIGSVLKQGREGVSGSSKWEECLGFMMNSLACDRLVYSPLTWTLGCKNFIGDVSRIGVFSNDSSSFWMGINLGLFNILTEMKYDSLDDMPLVNNQIDWEYMYLLYAIFLAAKQGEELPNIDPISNPPSQIDDPRYGGFYTRGLTGG
jgi:RHS repeat-associated protein